MRFQKIRSPTTMLRFVFRKKSISIMKWIIFYVEDKLLQSLYNITYINMPMPMMIMYSLIVLIHCVFFHSTFLFSITNSTVICFFCACVLMLMLWSENEKKTIRNNRNICEWIRCNNEVNLMEIHDNIQCNVSMCM